MIGPTSVGHTGPSLLGRRLAPHGVRTGRPFASAVPHGQEEEDRACCLLERPAPVIACDHWPSCAGALPDSPTRCGR